MRTLLCALALFLTVGLQAQDLAITNARVYVDPEAKALERATVVIRGGKIAAVGRDVAVPPKIETLACNRCVVFAGFWNTHVHFTESKWNDAAQQAAAKLTAQMRDMLTHSGFTTVVDTGSNPVNTVALRKRVEAGEVLGPRIYTSGTPLYPPRAIPFYLDDLPPEIRAILPQPETPAEAVADVERNIDAGSDIVKLFTGSYVARGHVVPMRLDIAKAAVEAGHKHGQLVFAHPSNVEGVRVAMNAGVDVLAHAPDTVEGIDEKFIAELVAHHMTMVPTLKLFSDANDIPQIRGIVGRFHHDGGELMFGTDTGFVTDYNLAEEYHQLALTGLTWREVLAMLTTSPARLFKVAGEKGRVAPGMNGDVTVLSADPGNGDLTAFTDVLYTIRNGRVIYEKGPTH